MMRQRLVPHLVGAVVLMAAACGTSTDAPTSMTETTAAAVPSVDLPSSSAVPAEAASTGPACEDGLAPALAAVDRTTGEYQWTYCSAEPAWREVRGATNDIVYVDSTTPDQSAVIAVDARSGAELWQVPVARQPLGWPLGPFAGGGVVVVEVDDDNGAAIVGLDAETGDTVWRVAVADLGGTVAPSAGLPSVVAPVANTDQVVVLSVPTGLIGLDRTSGEQMWSSDVFLLDESGVGVARGPAAVDGSTVIIPAASDVVTPSGQTVKVPVGPSVLVAVDGSTGAALWQGPRLDHPAAADGYVVGYVHSGPDSEVLVVDAATGEQLWSKPGRESYGDLWAIGDGAVYVLFTGDDSRQSVVAYELESGDERWRTADVTMPGEPQQVADDGVAVLGGNLAVLSTADGTTRWTTAASVSAETPISSVGHNAASIFVSFNGLASSD